MNIRRGGVKNDLRTELLHFFLKGHTKDIVVLYQNLQLYGTVSYRTLLKHHEFEEAISHVFLTLDENIWDMARRSFEISQEIFLPVLDKQGNLDCFCYQDEMTESGRYYFLKLMRDTNEKYLWINDLYPEIEIVHILGLNEYSYYFYQICLKNNMPVCLEGERWKILDNPPFVDISKYPDYVVLSIYAEGAYAVNVENECSIYPFSPADVWWKGIMLKLMTENIKFSHNKIISEMQDKQINCGILLIPENDKIVKTADEQRYVSFGKGLIQEYINGTIESEAEIKATAAIYGEETMNKLREEGSLEVSSGYFYEGFGEYRVKSTKSFLRYSKCKRIYLIGPCIVGGDGNLSQQSLNGELQKVVDEIYPNEYLVISKSILRCDPIKLEKALEGISINSQDLVILIDESYTYTNFSKVSEKIKICKANQLYMDDSRKSMFSDIPIHSNYYGNQKLAGLILEELIKPFWGREIVENKNIQKGCIISGAEEQELLNTISTMESYLTRPIDINESCGAIVMNCNPFTNGHLHLVEYAASKADRLIIFVVEEDKSFFPFSARFQMVKKGISQIHNVDVIPSGKFILSCKTLTAYFEKEEYTDAIVDATNDLKLFGEYVAPAFHISVRFAGEEPVDLVTKQYNNQMKELLPSYNIRFEEIKRLEIDNEVVSASTVRRYMKQNKLKSIEKIVPATSIPYIKEQMKAEK